MNLEARIEALEQARQPSGPKFVMLIERFEKGREPSSVELGAYDASGVLSREGREWKRRARESVQDLHDRVVRDLGHPPETVYIFMTQFDRQL